MSARGYARGVSRRLLGSLTAWPDALAQARAVDVVGHRPWPLPGGPWIQGQTWRDLLFAHWPVPVETLRRAVPEPLPIDTFDGSAWLGITPFEVTGLHLRRTPPLPLLSRFLETNVRTYVTIDGRPGIWFLSLDAASAVAATVARHTYRLPYHHARMSARPRDASIAYRIDRSSPPAALAIDYRPTGPAGPAAPGTLEHFLTERYRLYTLDGRQRLLSADIQHPPWPLQPATATVHRNTMLAPFAIDLPRDPRLLHFARRQDVVIWPPKRV